MNETTDSGMEQFMREAYAREDVHRFKKMLGEVATRVEAGYVSDSGKVIPIGRKLGWGWIAAAASVAVVLTIGITQWMSRPSIRELATIYARGSVPTMRGDDGPRPYSGVAEVDSALTLIIAQKPDSALALLEHYAPTLDQIHCKRDWLRALAFLQKEHKAEAIGLLDKVILAHCYPEEPLARELRVKL